MIVRLEPQTRQPYLAAFHAGNVAVGRVKAGIKGKPTPRPTGRSGRAFDRQTRPPSPRSTL